LTYRLSSTPRRPNSSVRGTKGRNDVRLLLVGDVHLSDTPPSVRTDSYAQDILDKLAWIVNHANWSAVDAIVQLGDLFHIKTPSRTSHWLVQRTAEVLGDSNAPVFVVPGNHDMRHDRYESLSSQPLGSLALSPKIHLLDGWQKYPNIFGIPYTEDWQEFETEVNTAISRRAQLIVAHAAIFPPGAHPPYPHWNADDIYTEGIPLAYGHIHEPHGFYRTNFAWFCNNGAISRGSLHQETLSREPAVTIFDSGKGDQPFETLPIPYRPADEVFKLAEHQIQRDKVARLDDFLQSVEGVSLTALSVEEVVNHVETSNLLDAPAVHEMKEIIETVS
jgi:DNA repair exonuclease SbcCD nuclease subunit